jgi:hypothetical protein
MMTKEHTVASVWIDNVDMENDLVVGTAEPGTHVTVVARGTLVRAQRDLISTDGNWVANFSVPGIEPWEQDVIDFDTARIVMAYQEDDDYDWTWVHHMFNQPPEIGSIIAPIAPVPVNTSMQVSGNFTDPDMGDTHSALWNWGDGITSEGVVDEGTAVVSGSHVYSAAGIYTV